MTLHEESQTVIYEIQSKATAPQHIKPHPKRASKKQAPWWQVYLMTAIFVGVLFLVPALVLSATNIKIVEIVAVLIFYAGLLRWVFKHEGELNREYLDKIQDKSDQEK